MWADARPTLPRPSRVHSRYGLQPQHSNSSHLEAEGFLRSQGRSLGKGEAVTWSALVVGTARGNPHPAGSEEAADPRLRERSEAWFTRFPRWGCRRTAPSLCVAVLPVRTLMSCLFFLPCLLHPASLHFRFHLPNRLKVKVKLLGHVRLSSTPWTVAFQAPLSMGFSKQEYWSGLPYPNTHPWSIFWRNLN